MPGQAAGHGDGVCAAAGSTLGASNLSTAEDKAHKVRHVCERRRAGEQEGAHRQNVCVGHWSGEVQWVSVC